MPTGSKRPTVAAVLHDEPDVACLSRLASGGVAIQVMDTAAELLRLLDAQPCAAIACDVAAVAGEDLAALFARRVGGAAGPAVILRATGSRDVVPHLSHLRAGAAGAMLSLRSHSPIDFDVRAVLDGGSSSADLAILAGLGAPRAGFAAEALVCAVVCGARRCTTHAFADAARLPTRTLQWRLARACLPEARDLLAWMLALHTLWRVDVLGWPYKRAALAASYDNPDALGTYIRRHVGGRPGALSRDGGFHAVLRELAALLPRAATPTMAPVRQAANDALIAHPD